MVDHHRRFQRVSFSFAFTSSTTNRTGHISLLGQAISITQGEPAFALGTSSIVEGADGGIDSVVLAADSGPYSWTATNNDSWLHVSPGFQTGNTSTNVIFSFDANPGTTRIGTMTIAGQTLSVTQAGSTYTAAGTLTTLVSAPVLLQVFQVALNTNGSVYFVDGSESVKQWNPVTDKVTVQTPAGHSEFEILASDGMGNLYTGARVIPLPDVIDEWVGGSASLITPLGGIQGLPHEFGCR